MHLLTDFQIKKSHFRCNETKSVKLYSQDVIHKLLFQINIFTFWWILSEIKNYSYGTLILTLFSFFKGPAYKNQKITVHRSIVIYIYQTDYILLITFYLKCHQLVNTIHTATTTRTFTRRRRTCLQVFKKRQSLRGFFFFFF